MADLAESGRSFRSAGMTEIRHEETCNLNMNPLFIVHDRVR